MKPPLILFPHEPFSPGKIDSVYSSEYEAARELGFPVDFYDHEALEASEMNHALRRLPASGLHQPLILRGWMIPGERYSALYTALINKGYAPHTKPDDYEQAHYLPMAYLLIEAHTARSAWIEGDDPDIAWKMYQGFCETNAIIKDWVKSAKHRWKEGCFIPAQTSEVRFREIYRVFRHERGKLFNRGVVLREFMPVIECGRDIRGLPIIEETRLFFWRGKIIIRPDAQSPSPLDDLGRWEMIANRFSSPFITIDVAQLTDGTWKIIEVGDGGVSGLPTGVDPKLFYESLWNLTSKELEDKSND